MPFQVMPGVIFIWYHLIIFQMCELHKVQPDCWSNGHLSFQKISKRKWHICIANHIVADIRFNAVWNGIRSVHTDRRELASGLPGRYQPVYPLAEYQITDLRVRK